MNIEFVCLTLIGLDHLLTKKSKEQVIRTATSQTPTVVKALDDFDEFEYYLSDGGYSRIWVDPFRGRVFLTSNSLDAVKSRWDDPQVQNLVADLLGYLKHD